MWTTCAVAFVVRERLSGYSRVFESVRDGDVVALTARGFARSVDADDEDGE
jgi:hypothetical protein